MIITFAKPVYLVFLTIVPVLVFMHFYLIKRKKKVALKFANFDAISRVEGVDLLSKNIFMLILTSLIVVLLIFSLADMKVIRTIPTSSFSFAIAIDASRSMEATDFTPSRLEAAKSSALSFVDATPTGTKIAVVSFSGNSFIEQSLTDDKILIKQAINNIPLSMIGGTDLAEAVITSTNLLKGEDAKSIILMSDGQINIGSIDEAVSYANDNNVIVHAIAIGTVEGGNTTYGLSKLDEDSLKALSYNTNGKFFNAVNKEELSRSYQELMNLKTKAISQSISDYLLIASVILIVLEFILLNSKFKGLP